MATPTYLGDGNDDGVVLGNSASHKIALFNVTPATQPSAIVSITDSTTGTAGDTINDTTASVKDDLASLAAKINEIIVVLRTLGIIAT